MTTPTTEDAPDWTDKLGDWIWAHWRWLLGAVVLVFVLNNLAGLVVGSLGAIAFANRMAGRVLKARRAIEQAQRIVGDRTPQGEE